jgi:hypothetical protein
LGVDGSLVVQLFDQVLHVCTDVVMEAYIRVSLNLEAFEFLSELFYTVDVFALLGRLYVLYYASSKVCSIYLTLLLFEHKELKAEQFLDYLSSELDHLLNADSMGIS